VFGKPVEEEVARMLNVFNNYEDEDKKDEKVVE
jgi:hypothetical protein